MNTELMKLEIALRNPAMEPSNAAQALYYPWLLDKMERSMFAKAVPHRQRGTVSRYKAVDGKRGALKRRERARCNERIVWAYIDGQGLAQ